MEWTCSGLPARLIDILGRSVAGVEWGQGAWIEEGRCSCALKTQVVPAREIQHWKEALRRSPFGPGS
eukprot:5356218-Lingulodinium_polyedra.AAC.1